MPSTPLIEITPGEIAQIVESVFATMLGMEVALCWRQWSPGQDRLTSEVHLAGDWNGAVVLECDRTQAVGFAGRFFQVNAPELKAPHTVDDVVRDLLGELANMIGGNLKCVLSRGVRLSMPTVADGSGLAEGAEESGDCLSFDCAEGPFWVRVTRHGATH